MIPDPSNREAFIKWSLRMNRKASRKFAKWQAEIGRPVPDRPAPGELDLDDSEDG